MTNGLSFLKGSDLSPWFKNFDSLFEHLHDGSRMVFSPACDVEETATNYLMSFDLPGISKDDIKIEVLGNRLTVSGERKSENRQAGKSRHFAERFHGHFQRSFELPKTMDADRIQAQYKDGVLQVAVPKPEEQKARQIKINDEKADIPAEKDVSTGSKH